MNNIIICPKPETISWDEIHDLIYRAHSSNRDKGIDIRNAHLSGQELKDCLGEDGACFVAIDGSKVVATCSVAYHEFNKIFYKGRAAYLTLAAVDPDYKGMHLYSKVNELRINHIDMKGCSAIYFHVAKGNNTRCDIAKKEGFSKYSISYNPYNNHYFYSFVKIKDADNIVFLKIRISYLKAFVKLQIKNIIRKIS